MELILLLVGVTVFSWAFRKPIHKWAWAFYAVAVLLDVLLFANSFTTLPNWLLKPVSVLMQKGGLGVAFFVLVMWIGVYPRDGWLSKTYRPIRGELSIIASILIAGHMVVYMASYLPRIMAGMTVKPAVLSAFVVACVLLALVLVLGATSFRFVKRRMKARDWKRLQALAYPFYALVLVHLMLMLVPSALHGSGRSATVVVIYLVVFGTYIAARVWRAVVDKRQAVNLAETVKDQGFAE